jgi:5-methylcytosine-specific restriction enzyme subunit McrC
MREEEFRGIRGRVDLLQTEWRLLRKHGRAACRYDELSVNSLPNQIIKSTLNLLGRHPSIDKANRVGVLKLARDLQGVEDTRITARSFQRVQLSSINRLYRFLLNVSELIQGSWLIDEKTGAYRFVDFLDDDRRMPYVFQFFVYNFLRIERRDLRISREDIRWRETLSEFHDTKKLHTEHLYQLFSYLSNRDPKKGPCEGILLYPTVDTPLQFQFSVFDFPITVQTLNLAQPWQSIHSDLANLVSA